MLKNLAKINVFFFNFSLCKPVRHDEKSSNSIAKHLAKKQKKSFNLPRTFHGTSRKTTLQLQFFSYPTPRRPLPSYNAQLTCVHRRSSGGSKWPGKKNQSSSKKKYFTFFDSFTFDLDERNLCKVMALF